MSGSGISWAICKSAPCSRQITTPAPHYSVFYRPDALPAAQPTASKHWRQILTNFNDFFACEILRKFDTKILQIVHLACHYTFGNPKKSFSIVLFIYTSDYLRYLTRKQSVIRPPHLKMSPHQLVNCETFPIWLKVSCVLSDVGGSEKSHLCGLLSVALKRTRCDVCDWNVRQAMSQHVLH